MDSTAQLPQVKVIGENDNPVPDKIDSWLDSLKLNGYNNRFVVNGYGSMDRVRVIWELELVTVCLYFFYFSHFADQSSGFIQLLIN